MQVLTRSVSRTFPKVRLVGPDLNEIVAIETVFSQADELGLDVVMVSDKSDPPVVRIEDFKKLQYEAKKAKAKRKTTSELKEIQLKVNITDHDLATKIAAMEKFLKRGDKVKVMVRLKGRERETPERASHLLDKVNEKVVCKFSRVPGPIAIAILEPTAGAKD